MPISDSSAARLACLTGVDGLLWPSTSFAARKRYKTFRIWKPDSAPFHCHLYQRTGRDHRFPCAGLADEIIESQRREIAEMKTLIADLEGK